MNNDGEGGLSTNINMVEWSFVGDFSNEEDAAKAANTHKKTNPEQNELRIQKNSDQKWSVWAR